MENSAFAVIITAFLLLLILLSLPKKLFSGLTSYSNIYKKQLFDFSNISSQS